MSIQPALDDFWSKVKDNIEPLKGSLNIRNEIIRHWRAYKKARNIIFPISENTISDMIIIRMK